jgi:hypothetical protein
MAASSSDAHVAHCATLRSACAQFVVFMRVRVPLSWRDALKTMFDLRVRAVRPRGLQ